MVNMEIEIVERSSGFWLVADDGKSYGYRIIDGPFETIDEAQHEWEEIQVWKEVNYNLGLGKERHGEV